MTLINDIKMTLITLDKLVNEWGLSPETFKKLDINTIQHASEITNERRDNKELRSEFFWTADSSLYRLEDSEAVLYFGQRDTNLIFRNIREATEQLRKNRDYYIKNYIPNKEGIKSVVDSVESGNTLKIKLSELGLERHDDDNSFFKINTRDYDSLNKTQRTFAERVYGQGDDFRKNMEMLNKADIPTTKIYVLNPEYVKEYVKKDSAIAQLSFLYNFVVISVFDATGSKASHFDCYGLRGVPLVAEGYAQHSSHKYAQKSKISGT